jgi:hypothetical protein
MSHLDVSGVFREVLIISKRHDADVRKPIYDAAVRLLQSEWDAHKNTLTFGHVEDILVECGLTTVHLIAMLQKADLHAA